MHGRKKVTLQWVLDGIDIKKHDLQLHWCKGEYYKSNKVKDIKRLIYPLPDIVSLGIHLSINLAGNCRFGPNAYYVNKIDYSMDERYKDKFASSINRFLEIDAVDLEMDDCGIRSKLQKSEEDFRDFYIFAISIKRNPRANAFRFHCDRARVSAR